MSAAGHRFRTLASPVAPLPVLIQKRTASGIAAAAVQG